MELKDLLIAGIFSASGGGGGGGAYDIGNYIDIDTSGMNILYEANNLDLDGNNSGIDTGIALNSAANIGKDFKIIMLGLYADGDVGTDGSAERSIAANMYEASPYPGWVWRVKNASSNIWTHSRCRYSAVVLKRINGVMILEALIWPLSTQGGVFPTANLGETGGMNNISNYNNEHNTTLTIGCAKKADGTLFRHIKMSADKVIVAIGV